MLPHVNEKNDDLEEEDYSHDILKPKKVDWWDWLLLNRPLKVVVTVALLAIVAPVLIYKFLFTANIELPPSDGLSFGSCLISREARLPCGYEDVAANECHNECCYDHSNDLCFHRFPSRFSYVLNEEWTETSNFTPRISTVPYKSQRSYTDVRLSIDEVSATHLTLNFYKSEEVIIGRRIEEKHYTYNVSYEELNIIINGTQGIIFNTERGPFIASDDIWEMAFKITDETMYGLGEIPLKEDTVKVIYSHKGGLSSIPLIFAKSNGQYHGLLIDIVAPTEISIRIGNQIIVRSITNLGLKFHLFVGPEPADIMRDVIELIGDNKIFEYWMLGTHICSEPTTPESLADLRTFITAANTESIPFESHCGAAPAIFNSDCDEEHVALVNDGAAALRGASKKFVPHVSPYIRYTELPIPTTTTTEEPSTEESEGEEEEEKGEVIVPQSEESEEDPNRCFRDEKYREYIIHDPLSEDFYIGEVDGHDVIYPRYDNVSEEFMEQLWVYSEFDGVVLENNWPLDESYKAVNETHFYLPYFSENFETVFNNTPQWNATRPERHLYTHNEYGNQFASAFEMIKPETPILSTSLWMNGNIAVNRQNVETSWSSLQRELVKASLGGISGQWLWSSPVCGDTENFDNTTQIRLCAKWYMAGTYMPMIKIHSKEVRRDPLAFVGTDRAHMITALRRRMSLMPYFYTVLQEGPLLRPMFYQFPSIDELADSTTQFAVGDDLIIVPNLQPSQSHVHFVVPPGQWYEFWSGLKIEAEVGESATMTTTESDFLTLVRGGSIIVRQDDVRLTTALTRQMSPYTLVIALYCETRNATEEDLTTTTSITSTTIITSTTEEPNLSAETEDVSTTTEGSTTTTEPTTTAIPTITTCSAEGKLYMTPNMTIFFEANADSLTIRAEGDDFQVFCDPFQGTWSGSLWYINVFGLDDEKNNYDSHLYLTRNINFCELFASEELVYEFV